MSDEYLGENLIFLISQPRAGSTLVQRVLSGHPDVVGSVEPWLMLNPAFGLRGENVATVYDAHHAAPAVEEFLVNYADGVDTYDAAVRAFAETIYGRVLEKAGGRVFLDKTPRYVHIISELQRFFPRARFVFLIRNPLSVLRSVMTSFVETDGDLNRLQRFHFDLLTAPRQLLAGMAELGDKAIVVRYEDFVADPEAEGERLFGELGFGFDPAWLNYGETPDFKGFMQDRVGVQQHQRPVTASQDGWKKLADKPQHLEFGRGYLKDLGREQITALGYDFDEMSGFLNAQGKIREYVLPWSVAIERRGYRRLAARLRNRHFELVRDKGAVGGNLAFLPFLIQELWRSLNSPIFGD